MPKQQMLPFCIVSCLWCSSSIFSAAGGATWSIFIVNWIFKKKKKENKRVDWTYLSCRCSSVLVMMSFRFWLSCRGGADFIVIGSSLVWAIKIITIIAYFAHFTVELLLMTCQALECANIDANTTKATQTHIKGSIVGISRPLGLPESHLSHRAGSSSCSSTFSSSNIFWARPSSSSACRHVITNVNVRMCPQRQMFRKDTCSEQKITLKLQKHKESAESEACNKTGSADEAQCGQSEPEMYLLFIKHWMS